MKSKKIDTLRQASRKLVRELGIVQLDKSLAGPTAQHCHALVEIGQKPAITISELASLLLLSVSATSRLVQGMVKGGFVEMHDGIDRREKSLFLTSTGTIELKNIDTYSNIKVQGAFEYLTADEQDDIINAIQKYSQALEKSRCMYTNYKILTLSTSRVLRKQLVNMVENIQKNEFQIPITNDINANIVRAEEDFYYNNSYNFWYAIDEQGNIIGSIGLKKINASTAELKKLFVDKRFRSKGVAQKLFDTLLKAALKHGFNTIYLGTVDILHAAHKFYRKNGFVQIDEKALPKDFIKCPLDSMFYCKPIKG